MSFDELIARNGVSARKEEILRLNHEYLAPNRVESWLSAGIPLVIGKRQAYRIWDIDGAELQDFHLNGGTYNLGHRNPDLLDAMRDAKSATLGVIYRALCIHLGTPPKSFDWQWTDEDGEFHRDGEVTPLEFADKYVTTPFSEYVCIVNDPRETSPMGRTFTIDFLGNVVGGSSVTYLNVDIDVMKVAVQRLLLDGKAVWMGCDVGKQYQNEIGVWDANLYDYPGVYDAEFSLDKAGRLDYHQTQMTHAMLFTGVDVVDGKARRWRVENSYGDEVGDKGFFQMNDSWFEEYMFEIAVPKSYLPADLQRALDQPPIALPPWDPMGALAC